MSPIFLRNFHSKLYNACKPPGDISSLNFSISFMKQHNIEPLECVSLSSVFKLARVNHINLFILDVEGAELNVLYTIDWDKIKFDVLCVEVDKTNHPGRIGLELNSYLARHGYDFIEAYKKNHWFKRRDFKPIPLKHPNIIKLLQ